MLLNSFSKVTMFYNLRIRKIVIRARLLVTPLLASIAACLTIVAMDAPLATLSHVEDGTALSTPVATPVITGPAHEPSEAVSPPRTFESIYTTVIQVSATIVAIVGGFLTTFGLTQATELRRVLELYRRIDVVSKRLRTAPDETQKEFDLLKDEYYSAIQELLRSRTAPGEAEEFTNRLEERVRQRRENLLSDLNRRNEGWDTLIEDAVVAGQGRHVLSHQSSFGPLGLVVLLPLTLFGILIPLWFLASDSASPPGWHKTVTLVGFMLGLLLVLLYIALLTMAFPRMLEHQIRDLIKNDSMAAPGGERE